MSYEEEKPVDLEALARVTERLGEALSAYRASPDNLFILDSVIKRFELTFELSARNLRRFLIDYSISATEVADMSYQGIIRRGDKEGLLLTGWTRWKGFRDVCNETVHTYHEEKARQIAETAETFLPEAQHLLDNLKKRLSGHD